MEKCDFQWEALRKTTIPLYRGDFLKREAAWTVCRYKDGGWGGGGGVDKKEGGGRVFLRGDLILQCIL